MNIIELELIEIMKYGLPRQEGSPLVQESLCPTVRPLIVHADSGMT